MQVTLLPVAGIHIQRQFFGETAKKFTGHVRQSRLSAGQNVRQM